MDYKRLLEKYWAGETTLAEEKALKNYFNSGNVAEELMPYANTFQYFTIAQKQTLETPVTTLLQAEKQPLIPVRTAKIFYLRRIAAAVLLLLTIGFGYQKINQPTKAERLATYWASKEIKDPKLAMAKTKAALLLFSQKLNDGRATALQQVRAVQKVGKTIKVPATSVAK